MPETECYIDADLTAFMPTWKVSYSLVDDGDTKLVSGTDCCCEIDKLKLTIENTSNTRSDGRLVRKTGTEEVVMSSWILDGNSTIELEYDVSKLDWSCGSEYAFIVQLGVGTPPVWGTQATVTVKCDVSGCTP